VDIAMHQQLVELIGKISSGGLPEDEILRIANEANAAYADPEAFLAANPDVNYDDSYPIPLGEWMVVGNLPDNVLLQADSYADLLAQIIDSFSSDVTFNIKPKQLAKAKPLSALNSIQVQLSSMNKEMGGYVLLNFSEPMDDELQAVLIYTCDLPRVMELCVAIGIPATPAYEAMRQAEQSL
jgi:hypothetical protein